MWAFLETSILVGLLMKLLKNHTTKTFSKMKRDFSRKNNTLDLKRHSGFATLKRGSPYIYTHFPGFKLKIPILKFIQLSLNGATLSKGKKNIF